MRMSALQFCLHPSFDSRSSLQIIRPFTALKTVIRVSLTVQYVNASNLFQKILVLTISSWLFETEWGVMDTSGMQVQLSVLNTNEETRPSASRTKMRTIVGESGLEDSNLWK